MRITLCSVPVRDQHAARAFYTDTLGFVVKHDVPAGEARWLTLVSPEDPDGPELLLERLSREVQRLAEEPIPPAQLERARALLLTQALLERETPEGRGLALGQALLLRGEAAAATGDLEQLQRVGAEAVQRVLRRHVLQGARVGLLYVDAAGGAAR